jgi:hypothetical protein
VHFGVADSFLYLVDPGEDPSKRENDTLDTFFGLDDSLGACLKMPDGKVQTGEIESVSFGPVSASRTVRITVVARLGKALVPENAMSTCIEGPKPLIATVSRCYQFTFNGKKIVPGLRDPSTKYGFAEAPTTSYQAVK